MTVGAAAANAAALRVCADPNNLPFSDQAGRGFENRIVELIASDLGSTVTYTWWAQRRGYVRHTLKADMCDVWPGVASGSEMMTSTRSYYRSSYVFVTRADRGLHIASFDDPQLSNLIIGVQMVGSDAMNTPPAHALARRGIVQNVRGYMLYGDYRQPHPPSAIIDAVEDGDVDVAVVWGPMAGYFAAQGSKPLTIEPVQPSRDSTELPMAFYVSMGVRRGDNALLERLDDFTRAEPCCHLGDSRRLPRAGSTRRLCAALRRLAILPTTLHERFVMSKNRGVVYTKPGEVQVQDIADPKLEDPRGHKIEHGVILKVVSTNICGSDQHMVRGRTTAPAGMVLGHEITGEVIEKGSDVEMIALGDLVSVPFNVACGRCRACRETNTGVCLTVNPGRAGGAYGYVDMGGWIGGQARYVMVPYADFNLLKFPDKNQALSKIMDLTMLTDILPTGFHGALTAGVKPGSTVYVAGAGPVGLAAAASAQLIGAAVIMIGDMNEARLSHARNVGFVPIDLTKHDRLGEQIAAVVGEPTVDLVIDAVGFEAKGHGGVDQPAIVLNQAMEIIRPAGAIGIPGLYVTEDPGAHDQAAKTGNLSFAWALAGPSRTRSTPARRPSCATIASS